MAKNKDDPNLFRITCTCDNAFKLAEGREESIGEYLDSIDKNHVLAIRKIVMSHYEQEVKTNGEY